MQAITKANILLVDDNPNDRLAISAALEPLGQNVVQASSGKEALRRLLEQAFALVILDVNMPHMDGFETAALIRQREQSKRMPIVFLTASKADRDVQRGYAVGASDYVLKPVDPATLQAKVASYLDPHRDVENEEGPESSEPANILLVDDDSANLLALEGALAPVGQHLVRAYSGAEALQAMFDQEFALVITDVRMHGLDGFETASTIRQHEKTRHVPIILLSAIHQAHEDVKRGYQFGAADYIFVPAEPEILRAKALVFIDLFRQQQRLKRQARRLGELERVSRNLAETRSTLIADLEKANAELEGAREQAETASRYKSSFLAGMSHELRTPLNGIIGFAELMHDGKAGPISGRQKEFLGDVLSSAHHLLHLINDVLDLSKVEAGRLEFHAEPVDMPGLLGEVRGIVRVLARDKRIEIQSFVDPAVQEVTTDRGRLRQVLFNYLSNALKFTPDEGQVSVRILPEGPDGFRLEVEDTGIGIRPQDLPMLFREFQQLDTGSRKPGTGLGLALTKRIVEAQGGRVGVESKPGEGSTFFAVLPLAPQAEPVGGHPLA